jgi:hypothetical protein
MSNKYYNWYHAIINNRKKKSADINEYQEIHHILPRSIGGSNDLENLIALSSREHFVCHYLLTKMYPVGTCEWYKMQHAFMMMAASANGKRYMNSRLYEACRKNFSLVMSLNQSGTKNSQFGKVWITNLVLEKNQKIEEHELPHWLEVGWIKGRIIDFARAKRAKIDRRAIAREAARQKACELWEMYLKSDCKSVAAFVDKSNYPHSTISLTILWRKHIQEYKDHVWPGKRRLLNN